MYRPRVSVGSLGGILLVVSAMSLLAFVAAAAAHGQAQAPEVTLARLAGGWFAASLGVAAVALALVAAEVSLRGVGQPRPEVERWLAEFGYAILLVPAMAGAALLVWIGGYASTAGFAANAAGTAVSPDAVA